MSGADRLQIELSNEASNAPPTIHLDTMLVYELGPSRFLWTRYPEMVLRVAQKIFVTAVFLPLAIAGIGLTILRKRTAALVILSVVPLYYFTVQSATHTEYRYVLAVNYFLFAFAGRWRLRGLGSESRQGGGRPFAAWLAGTSVRACSIKSLTHSARASQVPARTAA